MFNNDIIIKITEYLEPKTLSYFIFTDKYINKVVINNKNLIFKNLLINYNKFKISFYGKTINLSKENKVYSFEIPKSNINWFHIYCFCNFN